MENSSLSLFPSPPIQITDAEFNAFHLNDRKLYQILIDDLERDPLESFNIMAFWMWLEKKICVKVNLIHTLVDLPCDLINEVADESLICLMSCQSEDLPVSQAVYELAMLANLAYPNVLGKKLSLQDFHSNRVAVILNVNGFVKDVCLRAFKDVVPRKTRGGFLFPDQNNISMDKGKGIETSATEIEGFPKPHYVFPGCSPGRIMFGQIPSFLTDAHASQPQSHYPGTNVFSHNNSALPDDRTIFITFSKGYPVSEVEVRDFFTRRFGDCVQVIYMQDVPHYQQALYAKVVVHSAAIVDMVVQGGRAKYNIFGKHVWARKYVKKNRL